MKSDEELIAEAVAAGRVRRVPMGVTGEWVRIVAERRRQHRYRKPPLSPQPKKEP